MNRKGLYSNWLSQLGITIFTQTLHAFMLYFILTMLYALYDSTDVNNGLFNASSDDAVLQGAVSLFAIIGMMAIIKFEKLIRQMFGMGTSIAGDAKDSSTRLLVGLRAGSTLVQNTAKAFNKSKEIKSKRSNIKDTKKLNSNIMNEDKYKDESKRDSRYYKAKDKMKELELQDQRLEKQEIQANFEKVYTTSGNFGGIVAGLGATDDPEEVAAFGAIAGRGYSAVSNKVAGVQAKRSINKKYEAIEKAYTKATEKHEKALYKMSSRLSKRSVEAMHAAPSGGTGKHESISRSTGKHESISSSTGRHESTSRSMSSSSTGKHESTSRRVSSGGTYSVGSSSYKTSSRMKDYEDAEAKYYNSINLQKRARNKRESVEKEFPIIKFRKGSLEKNKKVLKKQLDKTVNNVVDGVAYAMPIANPIVVQPIARKIRANKHAKNQTNIGDI